MLPVDWVLLTVLLGSTLVGAWRGLVFEVLSVLSWVVAFVVAQWWAHEVALWLPMGTASEGLRHAAAFVLVFVGAVFAGGLVAALLKRLIAAVGLRPADRGLGAVFGLTRGLLLLVVLALVVSMTPLHTAPDWQASTGAQWLQVAVHGVRPMLPQALADQLP